MPCSRFIWALLLACTVLSRSMLAADPKPSAPNQPPAVSDNSPAASAERDEAAGYADPRNAFLLPERKEQQDFERDVRTLLKERKFDELSKLYAELIDSKARFATGEPKLTEFYSAITSRRIVPQEEFPEALFTLLQEWRKQHPEVLAPQLAEAMVQHSYAWQARGSGYANTVTPEDAELFVERLVKTRDFLVAALEGQGKDPHLHVMVVEVGRSSGTPIPKMKEQLEKALAIDPDYFPAYAAIAMSLLPRWYGAPGELETFIDESAARTKDRWGEGLYVLLAMRSNMEGKEIFNKTKIDWNRMKAGFEDLHKRFPNVLMYQNMYCLYALYAEDKETAVRLFNEIGEQFDRSVWGARVVYDRQRKLLTEGEKRPPGQVVLELPRYVYGIHFHPQTELLYATTLRTGLPGWDPATGKVEGTIETGKRMPYRFDFSADGELLAYVTTKGEIVVQNVLTGEDVAAVQAHKNGLYDLQIAADGSLVVGVVQEGPIAYVFNVGTQSLHQFVPGKHTVMAMALSPDGKLLAVGNTEKKLLVFAMPKGRRLKRFSDFTFIPSSLAFSPNGKTHGRRPCDGRQSSAQRNDFAVRYFYVGEDWRRAGA